MQSETNEQNDIAESLQQALRALNAGDYGAAEILFQQTLKRAGDHRSAAQMCLHHLSQMNQQRGNFDEAIRLSLRSLTLTRQSSGEDSEQVVSSMVHLAELYQACGKHDQAGDLYYRAKLMSEKLVYSGSEGEDEDEGETVGAPEESADTPEMSDRLKKVFARQKKEAQQESNEDGTQVVGQSRQPEEEEETFNFKPDDEKGEGRSRLRGVSGRGGKDISGTGNSGKRTDDDDDDGSYKFAADQKGKEQSARAGQDFSRDDLQALNLRRLKGVPEAESAPQFREEEEQKRSGTSSRSRGEITGAFSSTRNASLSSDKIKNLRAEKKDDADFTELIRYFRQMVGSLGIQQIAWSLSQLFKNRNNVIATVIGAVVFIGVIVGWACTIPMKTQPLEAYLSMPHKFRTTDGDIIIDLPDATRCDLTIAGTKVSAPMACYVGDWRDAWRMALQSFLVRQIYFNLQDQFLVDDEGTTFFPMNGKVVKLVTQAELIADGASDWFIKAKQYPTEVKEFAHDRAASEFENAFTNSPQLPLVQAITMPVAANQGQALTSLHSLYAGLSNGGSWQNEPPLHPGTINCCSIIFPFPDGAVRAFLIQAGDQSGKPLVGGHPGSHFFLALEEGKPANFYEQYKLASNQMSVRPRMIWIDQSKDPEYRIYTLLHTSGLLFLIFSLILLAVLCLFRRIGRRTRMILTIAFTASLFVTGLYFMENSLP